MAKKGKKKAKEVVLVGTEDIILKPVLILKGEIKDGYCHYGYKNQTGANLGKGNHKGIGLVHADMQNSFKTLNIHLAIVDDAFLTAGKDISNVDNHHDDELTSHYDVDGFEIVGNEDNQSVVLLGTKFVKSLHDRISLKSPKIPIHDNSSYLWKNELKSAVETAQYEVEEYMHGKHRPEEDDTQMTIAEFADSNELDQGAV